MKKFLNDIIADEKALWQSAVPEFKAAYYDAKQGLRKDFEPVKECFSTICQTYKAKGLVETVRYIKATHEMDNC